MKGYHIAVVGATGAAGTELLRVLERRNFPVASLRAIGSARSVGKSVRFSEEPISIEKLGDQSFDKIDIAFFSAGGDGYVNGASSASPRLWCTPRVRD
jgi:aspartate-semialdehyde dehydrogenase